MLSCLCLIEVRKVVRLYCRKSPLGLTTHLFTVHSGPHREGAVQKSRKLNVDMVYLPDEVKALREELQDIRERNQALSGFLQKVYSHSSCCSLMRDCDT